MRTLKNIVNLTPEDQYAIFEKKPIILTLLKLLHICILLTSEQIPMRSLGNKKKNPAHQQIIIDYAFFPSANKELLVMFWGNKDYVIRPPWDKIIALH